MEPWGSRLEVRGPVRMQTALREDYSRAEEKIFGGRIGCGDWIAECLKR